MRREAKHKFLMPVMVQVEISVGNQVYRYNIAILCVSTLSCYFWNDNVSMLDVKIFKHLSIRPLAMSSFITVWVALHPNWMFDTDMMLAGLDHDIHVWMAWES